MATDKRYFSLTIQAAYWDRDFQTANMQNNITAQAQQHKWIDPAKRHMVVRYIQQYDQLSQWTGSRAEQTVRFYNDPISRFYYKRFARICIGLSTHLYGRTKSNIRHEILAQITEIYNSADIAEAESDDLSVGTENGLQLTHTLLIFREAYFLHNAFCKIDLVVRRYYTLARNHENANAATAALNTGTAHWNAHKTRLLALQYLLNPADDQAARDAHTKHSLGKNSATISY